MPIITLTTDFGTRDGYVGAVKGVISRITPGVTIVDIAHDIPRGDIAHAAWVVATSTREFPDETIHVVVVDPGVGSDRPAVIARVPVQPPRGKQIYVGPDNGVFAYLPIDRAWTIELPHEPASATFHGRDVFAPAAAMLARHDTDVYGRATQLVGRLAWQGHAIVHIDQYGNAITNLPRELAAEYIGVGAHQLRLARTYSDVGTGEALAYIGSAGTVEIAVRDGRADHELGLQRGMAVHARPAPTTGPYR